MALFLGGWVLGILTIYIVQTFDIIIQLFNSWASVIISKNNATISDLQPVDDVAPRVGFEYSEPQEYYDDEEY